MTLITKNQQNLSELNRMQSRKAATASGSSGHRDNAIQWWDGFGSRLSSYFSTQKYSLFDNENEEIGIGHHKRIYGSTANSGAKTCGGQEETPSVLQCTPSSYQYRPSLNLMTSHYEPVQSEQSQDADTKPDPVAVLALSTTTSNNRHHCPIAQFVASPSPPTHSSAYSGGHELLTTSNHHHHATPGATTTFDSAKNRTLSTTSLSSGGKGQPTTTNSEGGGEYCLFSAHTLQHTKEEAGDDSFGSPVWTYISLKGKRPNRSRLRIATIIMGVISIFLLIALIVLLKLSSSDANALNWHTSVVKASNNEVGDGGLTDATNNKLPAAMALQTNGGVCRSESCREAGKTLYESINFTVNPCDDFFEYSCGNWVEKHPIPDDKSRIGTFGLLDDTLTDNIRELLESAETQSDAQSVKFAIDLYKECMDREQIEQLGYEPVKSQLTQLLGTSWPIINPDEFTGLKGANENWMQTFINFYSIGFAPVVTFVVQPDANQTTNKRIYFDSPTFGLGRKEYSNQTAYETSVTAYRKYMQSAVTLLAGKGASEQLLTERIQEIFTFESKLALASTPPEHRRTADVWYNRMSLNDFKLLTESRLDWAHLLGLYINKLNLSYSISDNDLVIVEDIPYYKTVVKLLDDTPDYVLYNYMGWMFTNQYAKYMGKELQQLTFEYQKAQQGVQAQLPVWKRCVKQVYSELSWAISRIYVDKYVPHATKPTATKLIDDLKESFSGLVKEDPWLDETTRKRALDKLEGIRENVAYPDWLLINDELDKYYGFSKQAKVEVKPGQYFESILAINRFSMIKMYRELPLPVNLTIDWPMPPAMVNAAYAPTQNSITIPVGILRPPFFDPSRPVFLNFGGIGSVIGHEITHGFDDQGRQFDKTGNLVNWWTEETLKGFTKGAQCFIKQYGSIVDPNSKKNLNGINTVGENIADNGGVREAYRAFQTYTKNANALTKVPHMTKFSAEQLFFLSYANIWCGSVRSQYLRIMIDYDPHSPLKYRVNVPLSNFAQFAKAWNCPAGSRMNPETADRCILW